MSTTALDPQADAPAARWTVEERAWKQDLPDLPDDVIALLATPVVVSASNRMGRSVPPAAVGTG